MAKAKLFLVCICLVSQLSGCFISRGIGEAVGEGVAKCLAVSLDPLMAAWMAEAYHMHKGRWPQTVQELKDFHLHDWPQLIEELGDSYLEAQDFSIRWERFEEVSFVELSDGSLRIEFLFSEDFLRSEGIELEGESKVTITCGAPGLWVEETRPAGNPAPATPSR